SRPPARRRSISQRLLDDLRLVVALERRGDIERRRAGGRELQIGLHLARGCHADPPEASYADSTIASRHSDAISLPLRPGRRGAAAPASPPAARAARPAAPGSRRREAP